LEELKKDFNLILQDQSVEKDSEFIEQFNNRILKVRASDSEIYGVFTNFVEMLEANYQQMHWNYRNFILIRTFLALFNYNSKGIRPVSGANSFMLLDNFEINISPEEKFVLEFYTIHSDSFSDSFKEIKKRVEQDLGFTIERVKDMYAFLKVIGDISPLTPDLEVIFSMIFINLQQKDYSELFKRAVIRHFTKVESSRFGWHHLAKRRQKIIEEGQKYIYNLLFSTGFFKGKIIYELGESAYSDCYIFLGGIKFVKQHPGLCGEYISYEGEGHQRVGKKVRVTLSTYSEVYPKKADFVLSSRVISPGSGMKYDYKPEVYAAHELLACYANMTKKNGHSIHYVEVYRFDDEFLELIGLELVDRVEDLMVFRKISNKTISKEKFDEWFNGTKYAKEKY
jgi:hypothetical protein